MELKIKNISVTEIKSDLLIVNLFEGTLTPGGATGAVDKEISGLISDYVIKKEGFTGEFGKMYVLPVPNHKILTKVLNKWKKHISLARNFFTFIAGPLLYGDSMICNSQSLV